MILIIKQLLLTWNSERNQRIKLQQVYFSLAILLTIGAGLMTLLNAYVGQMLVITAAFVGTVYITNAIFWIVTDMIVAKKISERIKSVSKKR